MRRNKLEIELKEKKEKDLISILNQPFCIMRQIEVVPLCVCVKLWSCILLFSFFFYKGGTKF